MALISSHFTRLEMGKKVADFADHRFYTYNNEQVSESWHMGIDFASVASAPIIASNAGRVVLASENGIYGLNIVIDHGFGLYSLYGHCSSAKVKEGDMVAAGDQIGTDRNERPCTWRSPSLWNFGPRRRGKTSAMDG